MISYVLKQVFSFPLKYTTINWHTPEKIAILIPIDEHKGVRLNLIELKEIVKAIKKLENK